MLNQEDVVNKAYENYLLLSCRSKKRARETNEKFNLQSNDMDETNQNVSISSGMAYDCLFVKVEDHYEIADKFKEYISVLDFTNVNFDNVDIRGIDFTGATGVNINPQTIYNKDLTNTICKGIRFTGPFNDVVIKDTCIEECVDAIIDPQTIKNKNISGSFFRNVKFTGSFENIDISDTYLGLEIYIKEMKKIKELKASFEENVLNGTTSLKYESKIIEECRAFFVWCLNSFDLEIPVKLPFSKKRLHQILFDKVDDHYEFNKDMETILPLIDFSDVSFDNVKVNKRNFKGMTGVKINPQKIYNKDLSECILNGVEFIGNDGMNKIDLFKDVNVEKADFTGSKKAEINPQTIKERSLIETNCFSVKFIGPFDDVKIRNTKFLGSTGAVINPQTLNQARPTMTFGNWRIDSKRRYIDMSFCDFFGVTFIGPFNSTNINGASFEGSIGAEIDPQTIFQRNFTNTNCCDVTFINDDFSGVIKTNAKFKGSNYYELTNSLIKIKNAIKKLGQQTDK